MNQKFRISFMVNWCCPISYHTFLIIVHLIFDEYRPFCHFYLLTRISSQAARHGSKMIWPCNKCAAMVTIECISLIALAHCLLVFQLTVVMNAHRRFKGSVRWGLQSTHCCFWMQKWSLYFSSCFWISAWDGDDYVCTLFEKKCDWQKEIFWSHGFRFNFFKCKSVERFNLNLNI